MRNNGQNPKIILALNLPTVEDDIRAIRAAGITDFVPGEGFFEGEYEKVYAVDLKHLSDLRNTLHAHNQKSILLVDNQGNGFLSYAFDGYPNYTEGQLQHVGEWREIGVTQASRCKAWSKFHGQYYVCQ